MKKIMDLETAKRILKENNYLVEARPRPYRTTRYERDFKYSRKEIITRLEDLKNRFNLLVRAFGKYNAQSYYEDFKGYTTEQIKQELAKDY